MSESDQLAWEARGRLRATVAAAGAAVLTLAGAGYYQSLLADAPDEGPGAPIPVALYFDEHAVELVVASVLLGLGGLLLAPALYHLLKATLARRPETPRVALPLLVGGAVGLLVGQVVSQIAVVSAASDFAGSESRDYFAARDIFSGDATVGAAIVRFVGTMAIAFAFVLIAINAMRAGLLTRFMGILGIIVGVLFVIPLGSPLPIVQAFWLLALAYLYSGRWPNGLPPAWVTGRAEPWPSQQELREARDRERGEPAPVPEEEPAVATPAGTPHPSSRKRKRKRRR